jgi:hypothetical protein
MLAEHSLATRHVEKPAQGADPCPTGIVAAIEFQDSTCNVLRTIEEDESRPVP